MFHPWPRLPAELKLEILQYAVARHEPICHSSHLFNLRASYLSTLISVRNKELADLSLDACEYLRIRLLRLSILS